MPIAARVRHIPGAVAPRRSSVHRPRRALGLRRPGDPPELVADASRLRELFGWEPRYDDLRVIVETALAWEKRLLERPMR